ncbi:MAG: pyridoxal-phosphate dependent enzyme [Candidatus Woesearchaeota archaeon]
MKLNLGDFPTPAHILIGFFEIGIYNLYIKRDDLTSKLYGGNKVRKLEYVLADAISKDAKRVITFGYAGSNHAVATAAYASKLGIKCSLILEKQKNSEHLRKNLLLDKTYNADMFFANNKIECGLIAARELLKKSEKPYLIPPGASSPLGNLGYVNAALELKEQLGKEIPEPDYIVLPVGTAGTISGLASGLKIAGINSKIIGVDIIGNIFANPVNIIRQQHSVLKLAREEFGIGGKLNLNFEIMHNFLGDGYGIPTKKTRAAIRVIKSLADITLEHTYSAKAFAAAASLADKNPEKKVLFWNTYNSSPQSPTASPKELEEEFQRYF